MATRPTKNISILQGEIMKKVEFCINTCSECPYLKIKYNRDKRKHDYYCNYSTEFIDIIDTLTQLYIHCKLEEC